MYPGPGGRAAPPTPTGNPYTASSAYPPPPRRTQPGTWQRPQAAQQPSPSSTNASFGSGSGSSGSGGTPTGADRFANFSRGAPTARKDPAQDRTNAFRAWQNMNTAQERQTQFQPGPGPRNTPPAPPTPPNIPNRPRPPPRQDTKIPSEDEIRAGMNYRKPPPSFDGSRTASGPARPQPDTSGAEERRSAWSAFQQTGPTTPGVGRSGTSRTPKKQGFDPNVPGSDERPAGGRNYAHRHRSEDFGMPGSGVPFPPPPPGPPPQSPLSTGSSPSNSRPYADPLGPFKSRESPDQQVPFTEGNRKRTPYTGSSGVGEKTEISNEGLRRSASTRDATKLHDGNGASARAKSTSPLGRHKTTKGHEPHGTQQQSFEDYSSSEPSDDDDETPEEYSSAQSPNPERRPHSANHIDRPKKVPTPPSRRFNGSGQPFSPPPTANGGQAEADMPGMQQKTSNNMYESLSRAKNIFLQVEREQNAFLSRWREETQQAEVPRAERLASHNMYPTYTAPPIYLSSTIPHWTFPTVAPTHEEEEGEDQDEADRSDDESDRGHSSPEEEGRASKALSLIHI